MSNINGRSVIITGASKGIGAAAALEFASKGANVLLAARSAGLIDDLAARIRNSGGRAEALVCDVSVFKDVERLVLHCKETFGRVDVLINNAGTIDPIGHLAESDPLAWGQAIDVNLKGVYHGMRAALPVMQAQGSGTIITVSSGAAHSALEGWSAYCSSKAGAAMLTRCADKESPASIRILGLSPGTVATDMQVAIKASGINPVSKLAWEDHIPADWPARALVWMCSDDAASYAGQEISLRDEDIRQKIGLV
jgi:3-oxoacyl-[acyl-carrier protein] reductase